MTVGALGGQSHSLLPHALSDLNVTFFNLVLVMDGLATVFKMKSSEIIRLNPRRTKLNYY